MKSQIFTPVESACRVVAWSRSLPHVRGGVSTFY